LGRNISALILLKDSGGRVRYIHHQSSVQESPQRNVHRVA
jgi:hypothetical protein